MIHPQSKGHVVQTMIAEHDIVQIANTALAKLSEIADADWHQVVGDALPAKAYESNVAAINTKLSKIDRDHPVGAISSGTAIIRELIDDVDGESIQEAVKLLKSKLRLHQCGRGRGNALVVLSSDPIPAVDVPAERQQQPATANDTDVIAPVAVEFDINDVPQMLENIQHAFQSMHAQVRNLLRLVDAKDAKLVDLERRLGESEAQVTELQSKLERTEALASVRSWS